jgi:hypothetical protein
MLESHADKPRLPLMLQRTCDGTLPVKLAPQ